MASINTAKARGIHLHKMAIMWRCYDDLLQPSPHIRQLCAVGDYWTPKSATIIPSCAILAVFPQTMKFSNILPLKMAKNGSWCLFSGILIPPDHQYFHLGRIGDVSAWAGWQWNPYLYLRGHHHEKQNIRKVANRKLQPPSSPKHCSFTQCQHARYWLHTTPIDSKWRLGHFAR